MATQQLGLVVIALLSIPLSVAARSRATEVPWVLFGFFILVALMESPLIHRRRVEPQKRSESIEPVLGP